MKKLLARSIFITLFALILQTISLNSMRISLPTIKDFDSWYVGLPVEFVTVLSQRVFNDLKGDIACKFKPICAADSTGGRTLFHAKRIHAIISDFFQRKLGRPLNQRELCYSRILLDKVFGRIGVDQVGSVLAIRITCEAIIELFFRIWFCNRIGYRGDAINQDYNLRFFTHFMTRGVYWVIENDLDAIIDDLAIGMDSFDDAHRKMIKIVRELTFAEVSYGFSHEELEFFHDGQSSLDDHLHEFAYENLITEQGDSFITDKDEVRNYLFSAIIQYYIWVCDGAKKKIKREQELQREREVAEEISRVAISPKPKEAQFNGVVAYYFTSGAPGWIGR